jgi:hypothetical protein
LKDEGEDKKERQRMREKIEEDAVMQSNALQKM